MKVNQPDLVLFVGEALVGNEAVDQLVKFNQAMADHSSADTPHLIDGIVLTKFDTIDDKVGSIPSTVTVWTDKFLQVKLEHFFVCNWSYFSDTLSENLQMSTLI